MSKGIKSIKKIIVFNIIKVLNILMVLNIFTNATLFMPGGRGLEAGV